MSEQTHLCVAGIFAVHAIHQKLLKKRQIERTGHIAYYIYEIPEEFKITKPNALLRVIQNIYRSNGYSVYRYEDPESSKNSHIYVYYTTHNKMAIAY